MELARETRGHFLYRLFCPNEIFLTIVFYLNAYCIQCIMYSEYTCFYISINITSYAFLLVFKIVENHQWSLIVLRNYRLFYFKCDKFIFPLKNNVTGNFSFRCNIQRKWLHILYFSISKLSGALKAFSFKLLKRI